MTANYKVDSKHSVLSAKNNVIMVKNYHKNNEVFVIAISDIYEHDTTHLIGTWKIKNIKQWQ